MGSQLGIGIEPFILLQEMDPGKTKGLNLVDLFRCDLSLNPLKGTSAPELPLQFLPSIWRRVTRR